MPIKRLYIDTETAPALGYFYGRYDQTIRPDQIVHNGFFLSYQAAWDDSPVFVGSLRSLGRVGPDDDFRLCVEMSQLIEEADEVIAHNAVRFDLARLSARLAAHKLKPFSPTKVIDTLQICRKKFRFEANSLDSVCQELGIGRKFHSGGFETSLACMNGDLQAWDKLIEYGKKDVDLLRELHKRILPWVDSGVNKNLTDAGLMLCPHCGGKSYQSRGHHVTKTQIYNRFRCNDCGSWFRESKNCTDPEKKKLMVTAL